MPSGPENKILANIVKGLKGEEDDPLTPLIDDYLIKRKKAKYRKVRIKRHEVDLEDRPRPPGRLSPSSVCGCERQAALKFIGTKGDFRTNSDQELIFEDGNWRHYKWAYLFLDMERVLGRDRFRVVFIEKPIVIDGIYVAGHLDIEIKIKVKGKWIRYVVDFKGANSFAYNKAYHEQAPDPTYMRQLLTYMKARQCRRGILLFESKDKNRFFVFPVRMTDKAWAEVELWCMKVVEQIKKKKLPEKHPECKNGNFLYNRCQYRKLCFGNLTSTQIERQVYVDFPGIKPMWERGHAIIEAHGGD